MATFSGSVTDPNHLSTGPALEDSVKGSGLIDELVSEVTGRRVREDAVVPPTGGPAGNAQLTAWTGVLLLTLVIAELITLLDINGLISWHVALGVLLIPVALLKTTSSGWRIVRYYTGHVAYRRAGPPPTLLRFLGPFVVAATLALLASGVVLITVGSERGRRTLFTLLGQRVALVTVHQALFIAFAVLAGLHLLARAVRVVELITGRATRALRGASRVPGWGRRGTIYFATAAIGAVAVVVLLPLVGDWHDDRGGRLDRPPGATVGHRVP
ncbi:MAG: hypothetical protein JWR70_994 [Modestobacter sp.]|nr:hypothetical protein [Modestobacter sp.]